jgi:hypothetical protein
MSANTPIGAAARIHSIRTNIASLIDEKNPTSASRAFASICRIAKAKKTVNTIRGSIAPSTAACSGFDGTRSTSQSRNGGSSTATTSAEAVVALSASAVAGSIWISASSGGASRAVRTQPAKTMTPNTPMLRAPSAATALPLPSPAIVTMRSDTTSGTTVIRIAFTQIAPIGSTTAGIQPTAAASPS